MFWLEKIISVVAPHQCICCGSEGDVVCAWCLPDLALPVPARCFRCLAATPASLVCKTCRPHARAKHVWVCTSYDGAAKQLVHDFKFERKQAAAPLIAKLMTGALPYLPPQTIVTHVPTATSRIRQRGYDHAQLLAKALAKELGLTYAPLLSRKGQTRQVGAGRKVRLAQLEGAFQIARPTMARQASILLVDDIVTTGATLSSATRTLKKVGAKQVDAIVFAQKL